MGILGKSKEYKSTKTPYLSRKSEYDLIVQIESAQFKEHTYGTNDGEEFFLVTSRCVRPAPGAPTALDSKGSAIGPGSEVGLFIALYEPKKNKKGEVDQKAANRLKMNIAEIRELAVALGACTLEEVHEKGDECLYDIFADSDAFEGKMVRITGMNANDGGWFNPVFSAHEEIA